YMKLPEGARIEMIDGTFYDMAAPTTIHQDISGIIYFKFQEYIMKNRGNCKTYIAPTDVQLDRDEKTVVQPDIFVVCNRDQITKERVLGAPDLVVEVLSPSNFLMDLVIKFKKYKNAGVREYWVIVPEEKQVIVYRFDICDDPEIYTFDDKVPVGIWDGKCEIDFKEVYEQISFLY
nr:Uma2 family endonuclease [Eubacterium sp.]